MRDGVRACVICVRASLWCLRASSGPSAPLILGELPSHQTLWPPAALVPQVLLTLLGGRRWLALRQQGASIAAGLALDALRVAIALGAAAPVCSFAFVHYSLAAKLPGLTREALLQVLMAGTHPVRDRANNLSIKRLSYYLFR